MKWNILTGLSLLLLLLQFVRPNTEITPVSPADELSQIYEVPPRVHAILKKACYDCHSYQTRYPWYSKIQPLGWWLQEHVDQGRSDLNFSAFGTYALEDHAIILKEIEEVLQNQSMPLQSYTLMHPEARLGQDETEAILMWISEWKQERAGRFQ